MLYKFDMDHNTVEATKNNSYAKSEGAVNHSTLTRRLKKLQLGCKNLNNQVRSGWPKNVDSNAINLNPVNSTQKVSSKLDI